MQTQQKNTDDYRKSLGSGMRSVFSSAGRTYYIIEYKVNTGKHRAGEKQEIIVDYIEMGRDPKCQIQIDDKFPTVSRRHAAITKDGDDWVLKNLSHTNPTLINGQPVKNQWYLQNGDDIQLSFEGPKFGFIIPSNPSVKSIGLTHRLSLFGKQAIKPYKRALIAVTVFMVVALAVMGWFLANTMSALEKNNKINKALIANMDSINDVNAVKIKENDKTIKHLQEQIKTIQKQKKSLPKGGTKGNPVPGTQTANLSSHFNDIYFIYVDRIEVEYQGEKETITDQKWNGTGFLLNDGTFVTSRHNIEPWFYLSDSSDLNIALNQYANNGGSVVAYFVAISPDNKTIEFKSSDFTLNRDSDEKRVGQNDDGLKMVVVLAKENSPTDWAFIKLQQNGTMEPDAALSNILPKGDSLQILGYPEGLGITKPQSMNPPVYGTCTVAQDSLKNSMIHVENYMFLNGNSGGPVFAQGKNGKCSVVAIAGKKMSGSTLNLVPISAIY